MVLFGYSDGSSYGIPGSIVLVTALAPTSSISLPMHRFASALSWSVRWRSTFRMVNSWFARSGSLRFAASSRACRRSRADQIATSIWLSLSFKQSVLTTSRS